MSYSLLKSGVRSLYDTRAADLHCIVTGDSKLSNCV